MEKSDNSKTWLSRLKYLKIIRRSSSTSRLNCTNAEHLQQRNLSTNDNGNLSARHPSHFQRKNSFRRSIINMHNHLKNVFRHNTNSSGVRHTSESSTPSSSQVNSRVSQNNVNFFENYRD